MTKAGRYKVTKLQSYKVTKLQDDLDGVGGHSGVGDDEGGAVGGEVADRQLEVVLE